MKNNSKNVKKTKLYILLAVIVAIILMIVLHNLIITSGEKAAVSQFVKENLLSVNLLPTVSSTKDFSKEFKISYAVEYTKEHYSTSVIEDTISNVYKNLFNEEIDVYSLPPEYHTNEIKDNRSNQFLIEKIDEFVKDPTSMDVEELKSLVMSNNLENQNVNFEPYTCEIKKVSKSLAGTYKVTVKSYKLKSVSDFAEYYEKDRNVQSEIYNIQNTNNYSLLLHYLNKDNFKDLTEEAETFKITLKLVEGRLTIKDLKSL